MARSVQDLLRKTEERIRESKVLLEQSEQILSRSRDDLSRAEVARSMGLGDGLPKKISGRNSTKEEKKAAR